MYGALPRALVINDADWAARCNYWLNSRADIKNCGSRKRQNHVPLILTGHGLHLRVHHGALVVRNGFTHYPQVAEEHRFFRGDRYLPSRIVVIDGSGGLSFDVLTWLSEQGVPLIKLDWRGNVVTVLGVGHASDPRRIAQQLEVLKDGSGIRIATALIRQKIENSIATLKLSIPSTPQRAVTLEKLQIEADIISRCSPRSIRDLLGLEGRVAYFYFNAWQSIPLRWTGIGRHPIPKDWYRIGPRQSFSRNKGRNRNASHPVNAILNYAYAILESQVRIQVAAEGYDPRIGFLHTYQPNRPAFVFDLMEPLRPVVDRKVLEFVQTHTFHPADFTIRADGVCRINPEMVKRVTVATSTWINGVGVALSAMC